MDVAVVVKRLKECGECTEDGWEVVLAAAAAGQLRVDNDADFVYEAVKKAPASILRRLLELNALAEDGRGYTPMHSVVVCYSDAMLEKCKMLPPSQLASLCTGRAGTPLHVAFEECMRLLCVRRYTEVAAYTQVLRWMLDQFECYVGDGAKDMFYYFGRLQTWARLGVRMMSDRNIEVGCAHAIAVRKLLEEAEKKESAWNVRWSLLRAQWAGVVAAAGVAAGGAVS
jgi:hypothetical protein